jgi:hypothetical protein
MISDEEQTNNTKNISLEYEADQTEMTLTWQKKKCKVSDGIQGLEKR